METLYLTRRNLLSLLSKLDRKSNGEESYCSIIKNDNKHTTYPQTMQSCLVVAVEDEDYYTDREPGGMLDKDEAIISTQPLDLQPDLKVGDYVLATKYSDGDPDDHWHIGFFVGMLGDDRYEVSDEYDVLARRNGFRRAQKISFECGQWLIDHKQEIQKRGHSLWWWVKEYHDSL